MRPASEDDILAIVSRYFPIGHPSLLLDRGDDCAVLRGGGPLAVTTDIFAEDAHFRRRYFSAFDVGWKALAVNISDVGSSGAKPSGFSIGLTLTGKEDTLWLEGFCEGMKALTDRFGLAISGGDLRKCLQTVPQRDGVDMLAARGQMILAARAAGIQCFDTVFTNLDDMEGFQAEVLQNKAMGFDGKSLVNPKQIRFVHEAFAPTAKEIIQAEKIVSAVRENAAKGLGVFTVDGKMIDIAFLPGAERTLRLAKACGMYEGDLV